MADLLLWRRSQSLGRSHLDNYIHRERDDDIQYPTE